MAKRLCFKGQFKAFVSVILANGILCWRRLPFLRMQSFWTRLNSYFVSTLFSSDGRCFLLSLSQVYGNSLGFYNQIEALFKSAKPDRIPNFLFHTFRWGWSRGWGWGRRRSKTSRNKNFSKIEKKKFFCLIPFLLATLMLTTTMTTKTTAQNPIFRQKFQNFALIAFGGKFARLITVPDSFKVSSTRENETTCHLHLRKISFGLKFTIWNCTFPETRPSKQQQQQKLNDRGEDEKES